MRQKLQLGRLLFIGLVALSTLAVLQPVWAFGVSFDWGTWGPPLNSQFGVYEADNTTPLEAGDIAQLIWTGPDGQIDPPLADGSTTGDDQILDINFVDTGDDIPPGFLGRGYVVLKTFNYDTEDPISDGIVYIRAWNDSDPAAATAFGNSTTETLDGGVVGQQWSAPRWTMQYENPTAVTLGTFGSSVSQTPILPWAGFGFLFLGTLSSMLFRWRSGD